jgi:hypothetical protein
VRNRIKRLIPHRTRRKTARRAHRLRIAVGFVILAGLIGIGVVPAGRGMVVRLAKPHTSAKSTAKKRPTRRRIRR